MFGESAVAEDAESVVEAAFFAEMRIRVSTMIASVAALVWIDCDFIANFDRCDVIANRGDDAASFVAGDKDVTNIRNVAVEDVAIRAANAAIRDFHQNI